MNQNNLVSYIPPNNEGNCIESNYIACMVDGIPKYYCDSSSGYKHPGCACEKATTNCSSRPAIDVKKTVSCKDVPPCPHNNPSNNDKNIYCDCRNKYCGSDDNCLSSQDFNDSRKDSIRRCCEDNGINCDSYIENDSDGRNPCNIPVNYMCEGTKCIQDPDGRGPYQNSNCDNECGPDPSPSPDPNPKKKKPLGTS